jgi:hypothetical protein
MMGSLLFLAVTYLLKLLVVGAGLVVALVIRRRSPQRAGLAAIGFAALLLVLLVAVFRSVGTLVAYEMSPSSVDVMRGPVLGIGLGLTQFVLTIGGWAAILVALFRRDPSSPAAAAPAPFTGPAAVDGAAGQGGTP